MLHGAQTSKGTTQHVPISSRGTTVIHTIMSCSQVKCTRLSASKGKLGGAWRRDEVIVYVQSTAFHVKMTLLFCTKHCVHVM